MIGFLRSEDAIVQISSGAQCERRGKQEARRWEISVWGW
jgi:hypothetical protein